MPQQPSANNVQLVLGTAQHSTIDVQLHIALLAAVVNGAKVQGLMQLQGTQQAAEPLPCGNCADTAAHLVAIMD